MSECVICRHTGNNEIIEAREMVQGTREVFHYLLCGSCGTLSLIDPPYDLSKYYVDYYSFSPLAVAQNQTKTFKILRKLKRALIRYALTEKWFLGKLVFNTPDYRLGLYIHKFSSNRMLVKLLSFLQRFSMPADLGAFRGIRMNIKSRILDVGCGRGHLLKFLFSCGFSNVTGCDPFIDEDIRFSDTSGIKKCYLEEVEGSFDLITLHHSFEHIPDPLPTLRKLAKLLTEKGVVLIRFPNIHSVEFERFRGNWWGIHAPRHFHLYSRKGLEILLEKAGLKIERAFCDSRYDHYIYSTEYAMDIDDRSPRSFRSGCEDYLTESLLSFERKARAANKAMRGDWVVYHVVKTNNNGST